MVLEEVLTAKLNTIQALQNRVFPVNGKEGVSPPYAIYTKENGEELDSLSSWTGLNIAQFEVDVIAPTYAQMKSLAAEVIAKLKELNASTTDGFTIQSVELDENDVELYEPLIRAYRKIVNASFYF